MTSTLNDLKELIAGFQAINLKEHRGRTFLEIAKCSHLENVWSNILAFFINPNAEHHLHDLLLKSIFEAKNEGVTLSHLKGITVKTEYSTKKGNRIDLVVLADNFILGIENKVEAILYNDLEDYASTIDELAGDLPAYKIVLSKYACSPTKGFINLTYSDLIKSVKRNIGDYSGYSDTKYLIFLLDFLKTVENNSNSNHMNDNLEVITFLRDNVEKVKKLLEYHRKFNTEFVLKLNNIDAAIERNKIVEALNKLSRNTGLIGSGQDGRLGGFLTQGIELIKYNIKIEEVSLFYQIGFQDYKITSHYWFAEQKFQRLENLLIENNIKRTEYNYEEEDKKIAEMATDQMLKIIELVTNIDTP